MKKKPLNESEYENVQALRPAIAPAPPKMLQLYVDPMFASPALLAQIFNIIGVQFPADVVEKLPEGVLKACFREV